MAQMDAASDAQAYEEAAQHRDMIRAVRATTGQHIVSSKVYRDCDAIGIASEGDLAAIVVLHADEGIVQAKKHGRLFTEAILVKPSPCSSPSITRTEPLLA